MKSEEKKLMTSLGHRPRTGVVKKCDYCGTLVYKHPRATEVVKQSKKNC